MADNFDTNVARRKPNVSRRPRPIHPWDVSHDDSADPVDQERADDLDGVLTDGGDGPKGESDAASPETPQPQHAATRMPDGNAADDDANIRSGEKPAETGHSPVSIEPRTSTPSPRQRKTQRGSVTARQAKSPESPVTSKAGGLSDSINIHSNYCKLDNDVSDHLLGRLSPSAQSVYLRLYRQSFGWNRNWAAESLPKLTKSCNMSIQTVRKAIKELETIGCIRREFSDYHKATVYRIFLPSEIGLSSGRRSKNREAVLGGQYSDTPAGADQDVDALSRTMQTSGGDSDWEGEVKNLEGVRADSGGQKTFIQSIYFSGTSIYALLESNGPLPKNITTYMTDIHLAEAVDIIDEFYDSIGFSVVSRSLYHKSVLDYFELLKSGFSHDDIRYAVRWTFKNSRSRPESFSLIKHTMHLAMQDFIAELREVSREKDLAAEKEETLKRNREWQNRRDSEGVTTSDMKRWLAVVDQLRDELNEQSFAAFIEPLKLTRVRGGKVTLAAPPDSVSWVADHYCDRIRDVYRESTGKDIEVEVE